MDVKRKTCDELLAFFGHHKCGTHWITAILRTICGEAAMSWTIVDSSHAFEPNLRCWLSESREQLLICLNSEFKYACQVPEIKGFHVVRDPRDICVSAYFSHLYSHGTSGWPELLDLRNELKSMDQNAGLLLEIQRFSWQYSAMNSWQYGALPGVIEEKLEHLADDPLGRFQCLLDHLGITRCISQQRFDEIIKAHSFEQMSGGRLRGEEDVAHHYRKGVSGDWRNYFKELHKEYFKRHYTDLLVKLGYETEDGW